MQEIICVLDKSGSMQTVKDDAVGGFNAFLEEQKKVGEANITLCWFDNGFEVSHEGRLDEVKNIESWPAGGMTALHDAIGKAFNHVKERFTREKPETVVLAILTDGEENASREFTPKTVRNLIEEHQEKYGWTVLFLAADQNAWNTAKHFGVLKDNAISYQSSNTVGGMGLYSGAVTRARMQSK